MNISKGREINYRELGMVELVREVLEMSGSKTRTLGLVKGYDRTGTTCFIQADGRTYLAFVSELGSLFKLGTRVSFRKDNLRAKDVEISDDQESKRPQSDSQTKTVPPSPGSSGNTNAGTGRDDSYEVHSTPETVEINQPEPTTAMAFAFINRRNK